jgi:hypothetical protein
MTRSRRLTDCHRVEWSLQRGGFLVLKKSAEHPLNYFLESRKTPLSMNSPLFAETTKTSRPRWQRVHQLPFSRAVVYQLINSGAVASVLLQLPNSKKGMRLIDMDSLDRYLESLATQQKTQEVTATV